jgi:hypothetical protein
MVMLELYPILPHGVLFRDGQEERIRLPQLN